MATKRKKAKKVKGAGVKRPGKR